MLLAAHCQHVAIRDSRLQSEPFYWGTNASFRFKRVFRSQKVGYLSSMRNLRWLVVLGVAVGVLFIACTNPSSGFTVSGLVSSVNYGLLSPVTITISQGSNQYTVQVNLSNSGVYPASQSVTYSVGGIPSGTYTMVLSLQNNQGATVNSGSGYPTYKVNNGSPTTITGITYSGSSSPWTIDITINDVVISGSETFDLDLGTAIYG
jgi:hypothetical protein